MANFEKVILKNKPKKDAQGQYNFGRIDGPKTILGIPQGIFSQRGAELYATVKEKDTNIKQYPTGIMWNYLGTKMEVTYCYVASRGIETDKNRYYDVGVAMYIFDDAITPDIKTATGDSLLSLITSGNNFSVTDNTLGVWWYGTRYGQGDLGDVVNNGSWGTSELKVENFPVENIGGDAQSKFGQVWDTSLANWTDYLTGENPDSNFYIVIRTAGDESEYSPFGHGWGGLSGGYKNDERDRGYFKCKIPKKLLYEKWREQKGETEIWSFRKDSGHSWNPAATHTETGETSSDSYGVRNGHNEWWDHEGRCWNVNRADIEITYPSWTPEFVESTGVYKFVNTADPSGNTMPLLSPKMDIDFSAFPDSFYFGPQEKKYFDTSKIHDFRPIVHASGSTDVDVQNYWPKGGEESVQTSAPNAVRLSFQLARGLNTFRPKYSDVTKGWEEGMALQDVNEIKYGFFVTNWNFTKDDPQSFEEVGEAFPRTTEQVQGYIDFENIYRFKEIGNKDIDETEYTENIPRDTAIHFYSEPGVKRIQVMVFSYIVNGGSLGYESYAQALRWKLMEVRVNLTVDRALMSDFGSLGGSDFVFLPYPDASKYSLPYGCDDSDPEVPDCQGSYIGSYPIVSGLSDESSYVTSLKGVVKKNEFSVQEEGDRLAAEKAYEYTPGGSVDEWGDYLGQCDIQQFRYFNGVFSLRDQLMVDIVDEDGALHRLPNPMNYRDFPYAYDDYEEDAQELIDYEETGYWTPEHWWDGKIHTFPTESPIGSIFISEYSNIPIPEYSYGDRCLFEFNCNDLDGPTLRDTSGNGCKAVLLGDYAISKEEEDMPSVRDSFIDFPQETGGDKGAF